MAVKPSNILIFGATGQIGRFITEAILGAKPPFARVAAFTSPPAPSSDKERLLAAWKGKGLSVITGDVKNDDEVRAAYKSAGGFDTVVSCLGRDALSHQISLIDLAEQSDSVQWFFPSEYGTDVEYSAKSATEKPHQLKLAVRRHLREKVRRVRYTCLVTGPYVEMWFNAPPGAEWIGGYDV
jgi:NAD(P)-dependent dehydrogenase (short-subunit alcohol dehydrogenase family)